MKKSLMFGSILILVAILLLLPSVIAINLDVEKISSGEVMIKDLETPVTFTLKITNNGPTDEFEFYNLAGFTMFPKGTVTIPQGKTQNVEVLITPIGEFNQEGYFTFKTYIRASDDTEITKDLTFKVLELKDVFEVSTQEVGIDTNSMKIILENKENINLGEVKAKFSSAFFEFEESFNLGKLESKEFEIQLDRNDFRQLKAGFYNLETTIEAQNVKVKLDPYTIKFVEGTKIESSSENYGIIIQTDIITRSNEGNVEEKTEVIVEKNAIARLFTTFSPEPDLVEREGMSVYYTWARTVEPGEELVVKVKTNWIFPLILLLFVIAMVLLARQYTKTSLSIRKRVAFVRTKGGEFGLQVTIIVKARDFVEKVRIIDRTPLMTKLYEKFGNEQPSMVNEKSRMLEWKFHALNEGETRMMSYVIYSKVGVLGKFALPLATAFYEKDGRMHEAQSNRAYIVSEQKGREE